MNSIAILLTSAIISDIFCGKVIRFSDFKEWQ